MEDPSHVTCTRSEYSGGALLTSILDNSKLVAISNDWYEFWSNKVSEDTGNHHYPAAPLRDFVLFI